MQPRIGAVILDMDGLMLDTEPLYKVAWQAASSELGHSIDDGFYARLVGRTTEDCERELVQHFGLSSCSLNFVRAGQSCGGRKLRCVASDTNQGFWSFWLSWMRAGTRLVDSDSSPIG